MKNSGMIHAPCSPLSGSEVEPLAVAELLVAGGAWVVVEVKPLAARSARGVTAVEDYLHVAILADDALHQALQLVELRLARIKHNSSRFQVCVARPQSGDF